MKKQNGVTIVALVITVIVLLILAGVAIGSLTGDEGTIKETKEAKEQVEKAGVETQIEAAIIEVEQKYKEPTLDDIIKEMINDKIISNTSQVNKETGAVTTDLGYVVEGKLDKYL